jgi:hypothetical protein
MENMFLSDYAILSRYSLTVIVYSDLVTATIGTDRAMDRFFHNLIYRTKTIITADPTAVFALSKAVGYVMA